MKHRDIHRAKFQDCPGHSGTVGNYVFPCIVILWPWQHMYNNYGVMRTPFVANSKSSYHSLGYVNNSFIRPTPFEAPELNSWFLLLQIVMEACGHVLVQQNEDWTYNVFLWAIPQPHANSSLLYMWAMVWWCCYNVDTTGLSKQMGQKTGLFVLDDSDASPWPPCLCTQPCSQFWSILGCLAC